jgi:MFS family permease
MSLVQVKAYSQMLQALPGIIFTLVAGPLSDRYGRRPLLIISLAGYSLLNLIFIINSFWFTELTVEYLLLESLQVVKITFYPYIMLHLSQKPS